MKKNVLFALIIIVIIGAIAYLSIYDKNKKDSLVFGSLLPLSGNVSAYGEMMQKGQLLALKEINKNKKDSVKISFLNTEHKKDVALTRLIEAKNNNINIFVELFGSDQAEHCLDYIKQNNLFVMSGVDTKPDLVEKGNGNFIRIMPSDAEATKEIFNKKKKKNLHNISIVYVNDDWGNGLLNSALYNLDKSKLELISKIDINKNQPSFSSTILKLKEAKTDAVCLFVYPDDGGRLIKEAFRNDFKSQLFATENFTGNDMVKTAQKAAIGVKLIVPSTSEENPIFKKMKEQYFKTYNEEPTIFAIKGYDAVLVMYDILQKSKGKDLISIKNTVKNGYSFEGASGRISFDENEEFISSKYNRLEYKMVNDSIKLIQVEK